MAVPLNRNHPLWELWFVDGLTEGRVAIVEKLHHALADGLASVELATVLFDFERQPVPSHRTAPTWNPQPRPPAAVIVGRDLVRRGSEPMRAGLSVLGALGHPRRSLRHASEVVGALGTLATTRSIAPRSSINVAVGQGRRVAFVRQPLDLLTRVERRFGVTINDVLLAAVTGGLRAQLVGRGEPIDHATLQVLVPVGIDPHRDRRLGNKVSAMIVRLPVGLEDPRARLMAVSRAVARRKEHRQALAGEFLISIIDSWPRSALVAVARFIQHQPFVNLVVTNVPGPTVPLYAMGSRMLEAFPVLTLAGNLSLAVAAFSYDGQLSMSVIAGRDECRDLDVLADGIAASFADLVTAAGESDPNDGEDAPIPTASDASDARSSLRRSASPAGRRRVPRSSEVHKKVGSGAGHRGGNQRVSGVGASRHRSPSKAEHGGEEERGQPR